LAKNARFRLEADLLHKTCQANVKNMLIILDRDGVINEDSDEYIKTPDEWTPIPGSLEAIARLNQAGHQVVVITNQSGIARGLYDERALEEIHQKMTQMLANIGGHLDGIFYCPHHPDDHCDCRKPKPGLMHQVAEALQTDFSHALMVGDAERDIDCAHAVGCKAALVLTGKGCRLLQRSPNWNKAPVFEDLSYVVDAILAQ
jgi:D-glycero-D-manno-heptose 1,7-bisphosphate phosphatase